MSAIDDEPRGRSTTAAVIIAVFFLAILGAGVGIVLGSASEKGGSGNAAGPGPDPTVSLTASATPSKDDGGDEDAGGGSTSTRTPTNTKSYRPTSKNDCPQQTDEAAGTSLTVKLYIRTGSSEVWICEGGGRTVYQGHLAGTSFPSATSNTTLFIGSVRYEAGVYAASNGNTTYFVSPEELRREKNGVEESKEPVIETYPG